MDDVLRDEGGFVHCRTSAIRTARINKKAHEEMKAMEDFIKGKSRLGSGIFESSEPRLWDDAAGAAELGEASGNVADLGCGCAF